MVGWQIYPFPRILPPLSIVQSPAYNLNFSRMKGMGQPLTRPIVRIRILPSTVRWRVEKVDISALSLS
jgi:hypothetical protein